MTITVWEPLRPVCRKYIVIRLSFLISLALLVLTGQLWAQSGKLNGAGLSPESSLLAEGRWVKLSVTETGFHRLDADFLRNTGLDVSNLQTLKLYGRGGAMLPERTSIERDTGLVEIPIQTFGDYAVFWAEGPVTWRWNVGSGRYVHSKNPYSDTAWYFLSTHGAAGKRVDLMPELSGDPDITLNHYTRLVTIDPESLTDITKYIKGGREWYGDPFGYGISERSYGLGYASVQGNVTLTVAAAARSNTGTSMTVSADGTQVGSASFKGVDIGDYLDTYAQNGTTSLQISDGSLQNISLKYQYGSSSQAWLNYIEAQGNVPLPNSTIHEMHFSALSDSTWQLVQLQAVNGQDLWDVTDLHNPFRLQPENGRYLFLANRHSRFALSGDQFAPHSIVQVPNQDLRKKIGYDLIILSHRDFVQSALPLKALRESEGLKVLLITPQQVYNDFSSGMQDVSAIRDMLKHFYDYAPTIDDAPQFLLLVGDASYDMKHRISNNSNYIPIWYSYNSTSPTESYSSDDYFGFLDDGEGWTSDADGLRHTLDIAIGRLPVSTPDQADGVVNKILHYNDSIAQSEWRNRLVFVADDEDGNAYIGDAESLAGETETNYPVFNIEKIYCDAFRQQTTPSGQRYPDVQAEINRRIEDGALIVNYIGHGGEAGWAHERILEVPDINRWKNRTKLTLFITATCEFARFDDPSRTSAGELALLNPEGGAIALFTTTRVVYASLNMTLATNVFRNNLFELRNGRIPTIGEVFTTAKNRSLFSVNTRNFSLLGDPSMRLALPEPKIVTESISTESGMSDTISALSEVTVKGYVSEGNGEVLSSFDGIVWMTVFDKETVRTTLANDPTSYPAQFREHKSIIFKGKATVTDGRFSLKLIVPKDIGYKYNFGRVSYYASDGKRDFHGHYDSVMVGGTDPFAKPDDNPPTVKAWINDTTFRDGGLTGPEPVLIARLSDDIGINTVGNGIGHEITATLNGGEPMVLNNYFEFDLNSHRSGILRYPMNRLAPGEYTLMVKGWDVSNNSASSILTFRVGEGSEPILANLTAYPNPASGEVRFRFEHNLQDEPMEVRLMVSDLNGRVMHTWSAGLQSAGAHIELPPWDMTHLPGGIYIARVEAEAFGGKVSSLQTKIVSIR